MASTSHETTHETDVFPDSEPTTSTSDSRQSTQYSFTPAPENSKTSTKPDLGDDEAKKDDSMFVCNICLDIAKDAVVSLCGHLFCWPCLSKLLTMSTSGRYSNKNILFFRHMA